MIIANILPLCLGTKYEFVDLSGMVNFPDYEGRKGRIQAIADLGDYQFRGIEALPDGALRIYINSEAG